MTIEEIKKHELFINNLWPLLLCKQWNVSEFTEVHQGIIYEFADLFINYEDVKYCVEHKVSFDKFNEWYDGTLYDNKKQNLDNFVKYGFINQ